MPRVLSSRFVAAFVFCLLAGAGSDLPADERGAFFETKIRPVLMNKCFVCHGGEKTSSGLRVDGLQHLQAGGERGSAIVPGKPDDGELLAALRYTDDGAQMPPDGQLSKQVVADFEKWIRDGAYWPDNVRPLADGGGRHWAFQSLSQTPPSAELADELHSIDGFLEVARRERGLVAVAPATRQQLIRRATFDLTGLPPTPEEVQAFLEDQRPDAFDHVVDRLLESPRYAERWARHWLDLVRYADTAGDDSDYPIPQAALYRDYVIDSFHADKPYDDFLREQIAGDLLAQDSPERFREYTIATGFLAQAKRFATRKHEDMHLIIEDTLHTIGQTVLGLTVRCARCHDHKYDPLTQEDYYALYGFFESTVYPHPGGESDRQPSDLIPLMDHAEFARSESDYQKRFGDRIQELESAIKQVEESTPDRNKRRERTSELREELQEIRNQNPWSTVPLAYAVKDGSPTDAKIQVGGDPRRKGESVPRGIPNFLAGTEPLEIDGPRSGRLELADWLASPENPLTARVMVNRIWQHHFGTGIVATPSNFGLQGEAPTHPELLDWLAAKFIDSGWSMKSMHRLIMSSQAYQRGGSDHAQNLNQDPGNRFYWRFPRRHLDAESIRDSLLWISGNLDLDRPGCHPFPAVDSWRFSAHRQFKAVYPSNHRSIYLMVQRLHPHPFLSLFNGATTTASVAVRDDATVPLQALYMSNSEFVHAQAEGLAARLIESAAESPARVQQAYWRVLSRGPTDEELGRTLSFIDQYRQVLTDEAAPEEDLVNEPWVALARTLFASNEFTYID